MFASPLRRAQQTAGFVATRFGLAVETAPDCDRTRLRRVGGAAVRSVPAEDWAAWRADDGFTPPGGESLAALQARVETSSAALVPLAADAEVVVVSHVSPIKAAIAWALGVGPKVSWRMNVGQASIHRIRTGAPASPSSVSTRPTIWADTSPNRGPNRVRNTCWDQCWNERSNEWFGVGARWCGR